MSDEEMAELDRVMTPHEDAHPDHRERAKEEHPPDDEDLERRARLRVLTTRRDRARTDRSDGDGDGPHDPGQRGPRPSAGPAAAVLAARIAVSVQACSLVAGLHGGARDQIATHTTGGDLVGVHVANDTDIDTAADTVTVTVGVVARDHADPDRVVHQVRTAAAGCAPAARITVAITARHDPDTDTVTAPITGTRPEPDEPAAPGNRAAGTRAAGTTLDTASDSGNRDARRPV